MRCFRCGKKLGKSDICLTCGQDVRLYKKVVALSWRYYDQGLEKAKGRDLSGAIEDLKNSLALYKYNIDARNLLGLVYYEMGEIAEALIQWVLSDNLAPEDTRASHLLRRVQSDQVQLERGTVAIRKYNQALKYMQNDSEDLAVLQLNKVLSIHPRMVKANLLMALLQIHQGQNDKAEKYIRNVLHVDRGNPTALKFQEEIRGNKFRHGSGKEKSRGKQKEAEIQKPLSGDDVIIPTYKENTVGIQTVLEVLAGIVIGAAVIGYLVMPSRIENLQVDFNQTIASYNERLSAKEAIVAAEESKIEDLEKQIASMQNQVDLAGDEYDAREEQYALLLTAMQERYDNEYLQSVLTYLSIDASLIDEETFLNCYTLLQEEFDNNAYDVLMETGKDLYNSRKYADALTYFDACMQLQDTSEAKYWISVSYINLGDSETADTYLQRIVSEDPDGAYTEEARRLLNEG
jgi:tetratricopeptide (TPR) repeat protein